MDTKFASFDSRSQAVLADGFVITVATYLINLILTPVYPEVTDLKSLVPLIGISIATYFAISILYYLISWVKFDGATIGKKLAGIKIVRVDGSPITVGTAIMRIIGYGISALVIGLGYLWVIWDKNKQGWHDKIAKTYVVKTGAEPKKKLLWALVIGFFLIISINSIAEKQPDPNISFVNPDGSTATKITGDAIPAYTLHEGSGTINKGEFWGREFELYEKASVNIEVETDYDAFICIMTEGEFLKFQKGDDSGCAYEVTASPSVARLEAGKYVFAIVPADKPVNYSVSLKGTK